MDRHGEAICDKVAESLKSLPGVVAVGLAGSQATGLADKYSDIDLQAFTISTPPEGQRRETYRRAGLRCGPLGHDVTAAFDAASSPGSYAVDWLNVGERKLDILWLPQACLAEILTRLPGEPSQSESAAALIETVQPIFDPNGSIDHLKRSLPAYPESRARAKTAAIIRHAHFFICDWAVLHKCLYRKDLVSYALAESEMVGSLIDAGYAVNQVWQHDRRKFDAHMERLGIVPEAFLDRLNSMLAREGRHTALTACHDQLLSLFRDLAACANRSHPDWRLPEDWRVEVPTRH
jgi:hypothetical protein